MFERIQYEYKYSKNEINFDISIILLIISIISDSFVNIYLHIVYIKILLISIDTIKMAQKY